MPLHLAKANHDSSWLIRYASSRIVLDPWLLGSNIDFSPYFSKQDHTNPFLKPEELIAMATENAIEPVVVVSHQFTDHFSRETLEVLPSTWRTFAEPKWAIGKVRSLSHFKLPTTPIEEPSKGATIGGAQRYCIGQSGEAVSFAFFRATGLTDVLHNALLISLYPSMDAKEPEETMVYCPHGIHPHTAEAISSYLQGTRISVLICTISVYQIPELLGGTLNLGLEAAMGVATKLGAKVLLDTHSEDKTKEGVVGKWSLAIAPDHQAAVKKLGEVGVKYYEVKEIGKWIEIV